MTTLNLGENKQLGKTMIVAIRTAFRNLTALHLGDIPQLNDAALKAIRIPGLTTLVLSSRYESWCDRKKLRKITDPGVQCQHRHQTLAHSLFVRHLSPTPKLCSPRRHAHAV